MISLILPMAASCSACLMLLSPSWLPTPLPGCLLACCASLLPVPFALRVLRVLRLFAGLAFLRFALLSACCCWPSLPACCLPPSAGPCPACCSARRLLLAAGLVLLRLHAREQILHRILHLAHQAGVLAGVVAVLLGGCVLFGIRLCCRAGRIGVLAVLAGAFVAWTRPAVAVGLLAFVLDFLRALVGGLRYRLWRPAHRRPPRRCSADRRRCRSLFWSGSCRCAASSSCGCGSSGRGLAHCSCACSVRSLVSEAAAAGAARAAGCRSRLPAHAVPQREQAATPPATRAAMQINGARHGVGNRLPRHRPFGEALGALGTAVRALRRDCARRVRPG